MAQLAGYEILAKCLKAQGTKDLFFIMGGPMLDAELSCIKEGIRLIDTRHEQGAAYMAQAYSRVTQGPGVCMAASGPATLNFGTGLANALIDCCPVVAVGVFDASLQRRDLVDFLEHLAAELADRARAAECHDRATID